MITANNAKSQQEIGEDDEPIDSDAGDDLENFWHTSLGKFKFCIDDLPQPLQYIYQILKVFHFNTTIYIYINFVQF